MVLGDPVYKATGTTAWVSAFREEILAAHDHALPPVTCLKPLPNNVYLISDV